MSIENIVQTVMTSKKYSNIIPETINRICNEESIKYKKDKDILRSSKKRLHIISESFLSIAMVAVLLLVFAYLLVHGFALYYRFKFDKEM